MIHDFTKSIGGKMKHIHMHKYFAIPHVRLWSDVCSQCTGRQRQYYGNNTILCVLMFENASQLKTKRKQPVSHGTQQIEIISIPIIENWSEVNYFNVRVCICIFFGCSALDFVDHCCGYC